MEVRAALAEEHAALGRIHRMERSYGEAEDAVEDALDIAGELDRERPGEERWPRLRIEFQLERASVDLAAGRTEAAFTRGAKTLGDCLRTRQARGLEADARWMDLEADLAGPVLRLPTLRQGPPSRS